MNGTAVAWTDMTWTVSLAAWRASGALFSADLPRSLAALARGRTRVPPSPGNSVAIFKNPMRAFFIECSGTLWLGIAQCLSTDSGVVPVLWSGDAPTLDKVAAAFPE